MPLRSTFFHLTLRSVPFPLLALKLIRLEHRKHEKPSGALLGPTIMEPARNGPPQKSELDFIRKFMNVRFISGNVSSTVEEPCGEDEEDDERRPSRSRTRDTNSTDMKSRAPDLTNDFSKETNNLIRVTHTAVLGTLRHCMGELRIDIPLAELKPFKW